MEQVLLNSPLLSAMMIRKAASQLQGVRTREKLFRGNPRLRDLESYVFQILNQDPHRL